jgi:manganese efflux pump family protein
VLALLLVAVALGLSNFAAAVGIGISGVRGSLRLRLALVFGVFETGMPLLGLALGQNLADGIGTAARWIGGLLLVLVGCYCVVQAWRGRDAHDDAPREWKLGRILASGLALSVDNLAAGFALGAYHVSLVFAAVLIGLVSVAMSLAGLELGARLGHVVGARSELTAGLLFVAVGSLMAAGAM